MANIILSHSKVVQKIDRIAFQILEDNASVEHIYFVGIANTGYEVAIHLEKQFSKITAIKSTLLKLKLDKRNSANVLNSDSELDNAKNSVVILVDDVLNTGETLMHAAYLILKKEVSKLRTVVLLDRRHRTFPIKADFAGLTLSTTLEEHIEVTYDQGEFTAYLK